MGAVKGRWIPFGLPSWVWVPLVLFPVWGWGFMWLNSHQGSSRPLVPAIHKARELILRYESEYGQFPENWDTLASAYPDDLEYNYPNHCEYHFWERTKTGRLDHVFLKRVVPSYYEGHEQYDFSPFGDDAEPFTLYVKR